MMRNAHVHLQTCVYFDGSRTIQDMNSARPVFFLLILLAAVSVLGAVGAANAEEQYYSVTMEVSDRTERIRARAISRGLAIVLRRITGNPQLPNSPAVSTALASADRYALRFGYEGLGEGRSALTVQFDPRGVRQVIEEAGLDAWSLERPRVMAWVLLEDADGESILDSASTHAISDAMQASATEFGVPLVLPLMDIDERLEIQPMLLRGLFLDLLREASRRYNTQFILVGRLRVEEDENWTGVWTLAQPGAPLSERSFEGKGTEVAHGAMGFVLEALSSRFALNVNQETRVRISVEGIHALVDYAELFNYLRGLDGVERAELHELTQDLLTLDLWLATSWDGFLDLLGQQRRLSPVFVVDLPEGEKRMVWRAES